MFLLIGDITLTIHYLKLKSIKHVEPYREAREGNKPCASGFNIGCAQGQAPQRGQGQREVHLVASMGQGRALHLHQ